MYLDAAQGLLYYILMTHWGTYIKGPWFCLLSHFSSIFSWNKQQNGGYSANIIGPHHGYT